MTISEVLSEIGDEHLCYQNLTQDLSNVSNGKKDSKITFRTDKGKGFDLANAVAMGGTPKFTAWIVWIPTDKLKAVLEANS